MTTFYKNYIALCAQKKKSASAVATEVGLSRTSPNGWKKGKNPSDINLEKLAAYFGVSVSDLLSEQKEKPTLQAEGERIPNYSKLSETNKAIVDSMIAQLLAAQLED